MPQSSFSSEEGGNGGVEAGIQQTPVILELGHRVGGDQFTHRIKFNLPTELNPNCPVAFCFF